MEGVNIRLLGQDYLLMVGHIHCEAFPKDVRSQLGARVVAKNFERHLTTRKNVRALGAFEVSTGELLGFCFGGLSGERIGGWGARNFPFIASRLLLRPRLLMHPGIWKRVASRWGRSSLQKTSPESEDGQADFRRYEIFSLAVRSDVRNVGIGKLLMGKQEEYALGQGCVAISLGAPTDDRNTIAFYERIGFQKKTQEGQAWSGQMIKILEPRARLVPSGRTFSKPPEI